MASTWFNRAWDRSLREKAADKLISDHALRHPPDLGRILAATHAARNAEAYRERHLAGYVYDEPTLEYFERHRPVAGVGLEGPSPVEVYFCLRDQSQSMFDRSREEYEPSADEIEVLCAGCWPLPRDGSPADGRGVPDGLLFAGDTAKGFALFTDLEGRLFVRDGRGRLEGYSGSLRYVTLGNRP